MIQVNILEQLKRLFEIFRTNPYVLMISISAIVFFGILLVANKLKNKIITKIICILVYLIIFGTLIFFYHSEILKLFDYLMNNIFLFLFFPNLAVYVLVLIIINFIIVKSTFSKNENKVVRIINIVCFILFNIIFYLIIDNVIKNKIDVYEQLSIYTNNDLLILVELSMNLFLLWLVILLIIKVSNNLINKVSIKKVRVVNNEAIDKELENVPLASSIDLTNFMEIQAPTIYNDFNDYLDIEPIKKNNKFINLEIESQELEKIEEEYNIQEEVSKNLESENNLDIVLVNETLEDNYNLDLSVVDSKNTIELESEATLEKELSEEKVNPITAFDLGSIDNTEEIENSIKEEKEETNLLTTFDIVDNYQSDNYLEVENQDINKNLYEDYYKEDSLENNMNLLFGNSNNYLNSIVDDINKLRDNQDDKNQIKKIYENIKLSQKDLTLSDYNNLIRMLIEIKK